MSGVTAGDQATLQQGQQSILHRLMAQIIIYFDVVFNFINSTVLMTGQGSKDVSSHYLY